jgi:hypothetical protein
MLIVEKMILFTLGHLSHPLNFAMTHSFSTRSSHFSPSIPSTAHIQIYLIAHVFRQSVSDINDSITPFRLLFLGRFNPSRVRRNHCSRLEMVGWNSEPYYSYRWSYLESRSETVPNKFAAIAAPFLLLQKLKRSSPLCKTKTESNRVDFWRNNTFPTIRRLDLFGCLLYFGSPRANDNFPFQSAKCFCAPVVLRIYSDEIFRLSRHCYVDDLHRLPPFTWSHLPNRQF